MSDLSASQPGPLLVIPSVGFGEDGNGLWFDKKFVEGMALNKRLWGGDLRCLMRRQAVSTLPFGGYFTREDLPFALTPLDDGEPISETHLRGASAILAAGDDVEQLGVASIPKSARPPVCYIIENSSNTRYRMIAVDNAPLFKRAKSMVWTWLAERKRAKALAAADAIQANGVPAYDQYAPSQSNALLYFDTRMREDMTATGADVDAKAKRLLSGEPLRLVFSGRLERIKGADHLPRVARALRDMGVRFRLEIFGAGSLMQAMENDVAEAGLSDQVVFMGGVDFETVLALHVRASTDIFVCCHRQSDPSCTYLETYGCGAPIAGYDNAAFEGVRAMSGAGWSVPMDRPDLLAQQIAELDADRAAIVEHMKKALAFAREHTFEKTFENRIGQLRALARPSA